MQTKNLTRKKRIRGKIFGDAVRPRLTVFRSNKYVYAQIINDEKGVTISAVTKQKNPTEAGEKLADLALKAKVKKIAFDRNGYRYHGRIKALAEAARKKGLDFNMYNNMERPEKEFSETVVQINRISKKTKGGNQMRFAALVVVGYKKGKVGVGLSKAKDVRGAINKAINFGKRRMIQVPLRGTTLPFEIKEKYGAAYIILKPAPPGTGIVAGGPIRVVVDAAGVHDVVGKILGTKNKISNVYATIAALERIAVIDERRNERTAGSKKTK